LGINNLEILELIDKTIANRDCKRARHGFGSTWQPAAVENRFEIK
jgi:hypothetical protein